jgi:hypothetical protein
MEIEFASGGRIRISGSSTVSAFKRDPRGGHLFALVVSRVFRTFGLG